MGQRKRKSFVAFVSMAPIKAPKGGYFESFNELLHESKHTNNNIIDMLMISIVALVDDVT
jgi:hypothetical protein